MATILAYTKSTYGSPYAFYRCDVSVSGRTATSVTITATAYGYLQYSTSFINKGSGMGIVAGLYVGGAWHNWTLKADSVKWSGTTVHSATASFTVSGLTASQTSLTGVQFRVLRSNTSNTAASMSAKSCSNITISASNNADVLNPQNNAPVLGQGDTMISQNTYYAYHDLVASATTNGANHSKTLASKYTTATSVTWDAATYGSWFPTDSKYLTVTLTNTGYTSTTSAAGLSYTVNIVMSMPQSLGKPSLPGASITSRNATTTTITLTRPTTYKYGATFGEWDLECSHGTVTIADPDNAPNVATLTVPSGTNETVVVYVKAIDSRGIPSDELPIVCYTRQYGPLVYKDGVWVYSKPYYYNSGWKASDAYVYNSGWKD